MWLGYEFSALRRLDGTVRWWAVGWAWLDRPGWAIGVKHCQWHEADGDELIVKAMRLRADLPPVRVEAVHLLPELALRVVAESAEFARAWLPETDENAPPG